MSQSSLFYEDEQNDLVPESFDVGKEVRDANYHMITKQHLGECQALVYQTLVENPSGLTDTELSVLTGLPRSSINGRRNELVKKGLVVFSHKKKSSDYNGNMKQVCVWSVNHPHPLISTGTLK